MAARRKPRSTATPVQSPTITDSPGGWSTCEEVLAVLNRLSWPELYRLRDHMAGATPKELIHPEFDVERIGIRYDLLEFRESSVSTWWPRPMSGPGTGTCQELMRMLQRELWRNEKSWLGGTIQALARAAKQLRRKSIRNRGRQSIRERDAEIVRLSRDGLTPKAILENFRRHRREWLVNSVGESLTRGRIADVVKREKRKWKRGVV